MTLAQEITQGSEKLIKTAGLISKAEPNMAIAQLLLAASVLAKTIGMGQSEFMRGCNLARTEVYED